MTIDEQSPVEASLLSAQTPSPVPEGPEHSAQHPHIIRTWPLTEEELDDIEQDLTAKRKPM
jgi:hypothetical protein